MKYILLGVVILLLFTHVNARTIYKVYESGQCLVPASPIISVSTCEQQAELAGWSDTSATSVSFSSYLPTGCILQTSTNDLRVRNRPKLVADIDLITKSKPVQHWLDCLNDAIYDLEQMRDEIEKKIDPLIRSQLYGV